VIILGVNIMVKFGDKVYRGYTWEVTEKESYCHVKVVQIEKSGVYTHSLQHALGHDIPKDLLEHFGIPRDPITGEPTEEWIKLQIDRYISGSDGFGIDEYNFSDEEIARRRKDK
jgi:hypothetical protein